VSECSKGNGDKGGGQVKATRAMATAMAMATMWEMAMATRPAGDEEGRGKGGKGNDNVSIYYAFAIVGTLRYLQWQKHCIFTKAQV
jgi:hypothetical protein